MTTRVAVTGVGAISPVGLDSKESWNSIKNGKLITDGGRVLSIVCQDKDFDKVFEKAYKNLKEIHFDGIYFRNDIGHQVRKNFSKEN